MQLPSGGPQYSLQEKQLIDSLEESIVIELFGLYKKGYPLKPTLANHAFSETIVKAGYPELGAWPGDEGKYSSLTRFDIDGVALEYGLLFPVRNHSFINGSRPAVINQFYHLHTYFARQLGKSDAARSKHIEFLARVSFESNYDMIILDSLFDFHERAFLDSDSTISGALDDDSLFESDGGLFDEFFSSSAMTAYLSFPHSAREVVVTSARRELVAEFLYNFSYEVLHNTLSRRSLYQLGAEAFPDPEVFWRLPASAAAYAYVNKQQ